MCWKAIVKAVLPPEEGAEGLCIVETRRAFGARFCFAVHNLHSTIELILGP